MLSMGISIVRAWAVLLSCMAVLSRRCYKNCHPSRGGKKVTEDQLSKVSHVHNEALGMGINPIMANLR